MMQEKANIYKFPPKFTKNDTKIVQKQALFSGIKHLFCLKKTGQNRRFNLWKCAVSGCAWKDPERILSVFMHFYEGVDDF